MGTLKTTVTEHIFTAVCIVVRSVENYVSHRSVNNSPVLC
jgi:hypothetical protein